MLTIGAAPLEFARTEKFKIEKAYKRKAEVRSRSVSATDKAEGRR